MSFPTQNDRRDVPRTTSQSGRQEWIPRGSTATIPAIANDQPGFNIYSNEDSANNNLPPNRQHRRQPQVKDHVAHPSNQLRGRGRPEEIRRRGQYEERRERGRGMGRGRGRGEEKSGCQEEKATKESNVPQLVQEIQEKLTKGSVECLICYDMVKRSAPIWSCSSCYSIFHLNCIKKWARAPTSVDLAVEKNVGFNWRCPGCQSVQLTAHKEIQYVCFCAKRQDPPSDLYLTPHSCGEPCGKPLERELQRPGNNKEDLCPHACVLQCHPGPCPPCKAFAPPHLCPCGKKLITTRCADRKSVLTCGQRCDKLLDCWRHRCERICHVDSCGTCQVVMNASCFCKKSANVILCGDMAVKGEVKPEDGVFACNSTCGKKLSCGNHVCNNICHPGPCAECDLMPDKINTCCCGKTALQEKRQNCLDPIPTCDQICGKLLPCGIHHCKGVCHIGDCEPCLVMVTQKCRCGSTSRSAECFKTTATQGKFLCEKPCGRKKNCGRHRCSEKCCTLSNSNGTHTDDWDPHFCSMSCGKKLRCGQHSCESLCHSGHCPPCLETIFSDLTCACGKTSIPPPQPCGTPPPSCQLACAVPQPCGHSSSHRCHFGDCPPCSIPIAKECIGGHVLLRNIPCGSKDIRCNKVCGKTRQCGMHACEKTCHPPPCDSSGGTASGIKNSCGQICGAPRRDCRHTCPAPCHPSAFCPDVRCNFLVTISCSCGRMSANVPCDAGGSTGNFNVDTIYEASFMQKLPGPLQPVEANGKKIPLGQRKLMCDDECAKMERKRVLADAFDVTTPNLDALHFGEISAVSEILSDLIRHDPKWVLSVEERCKYLVLAKTKATTLRVHVFSPMPKIKRDAVRVIADRWKLVIHAAGWEPKRFLVVHATAKSKAPTRMIGAKGTPVNISHPLTYDSLIDMDPRLVVSLFDLPSESDISALVLRFGGECQLLWLNDKNALAVFSDPARAATAMRRLDNASVYHGAVIIHQNGGSSGAAPNAWGGGAASSLNGWKTKSSAQESSSWGSDCGDQQASAWKDKDAAPIMATVNRWNVLDSNKSVDVPLESNASGSSSVQQIAAELNDKTEVLDDWEKAFE